MYFCNGSVKSTQTFFILVHACLAISQKCAWNSLCGGKTNTDPKKKTKESNEADNGGDLMDDEKYLPCPVSLPSLSLSISSSNR